ncbi:MAG: pyridoxal phosphate-dependent aminotransferase [Anaerolineaceae bacterium]|jgi:cystathionine beta-lyase|nr:pyridoxal phosphate-dependent aminotransferase [Anaerolineaceae bacterium]MDD4043570.1 pyridoxal phosphate-dependent aminotransferase [Anaerolineaceae bacterium]MDD4578212.1 pyridoxal phosphate-dependent aminotransferase [Anaerolineaceae bacterium]
MDFDLFIDRKPTESLKWNCYPDDVLPLWVADTDFRCPPAVMEALHKRVDHGIFGYGMPPEGLDQVVIDRFKRLYDWQVTPDQIGYVPGIVTGFTLILRALCEKGDAVIFQTPAYPPFIGSPKASGLIGIQNPMYLDAEGVYRIDFDLFERQIIDNEVRIYILCNPQNPTGRVFNKEELLRLAEICLRHNVTICSDEIHCDILFENRTHIPIASLDPEISKQTATFMAPSKTYNIAGLHASVAVIQDEAMRKAFQDYKSYLISSPGVLAMVAAKAAYEHGDEWLREQTTYLQANRDLIGELIDTGKLSGITWSKPEGTFLAWLDCRQLGIKGNAQQYFMDQAKVCLNDGCAFGDAGEGFLRLNFGCTRAVLQQGLDQIADAIRKI